MRMHEKTCAMFWSIPMMSLSIVRNSPNSITVYFSHWSGKRTKRCSNLPFVLSFLRKFRNSFSRAPHFRINRINYRSLMKMLKCAFFHARIWIVWRLPKRLSSQCFNCFEFWTKCQFSSDNDVNFFLFFRSIFVTFISHTRWMHVQGLQMLQKDLLMQIRMKCVYFNNRQYGSSFNQKFDKTMRHNEVNK